MGLFDRNKGDARAASPQGEPRAVADSDAGAPLEVDLSGFLQELDTCSTRLDRHDHRVREIELELEGLKARMKELTTAVAQGIEHVDRSERRVRATVARARRELEEHGVVSPGVEAEWAELRGEDGERSEGGGMQPVREEVARDPGRSVTLPDAYPGAWTEGDLESLMGG
jgi:hypothetical protein